MKPEPTNICSNLQLLRDYVQGARGKSANRVVEEHLAQCERCAEIVDLMEFRSMAEIFPRSLVPPLSSTTPDLNMLLSRLRDLPRELN